MLLRKLFTYNRTRHIFSGIALNPNMARDLTYFTLNITTVVKEATLKAGRLWYTFIPSLMTVLMVFSPFSQKLQICEICHPSRRGRKVTVLMSCLAPTTMCPVVLAMLF